MLPYEHLRRPSSDASASILGHGGVDLVGPGQDPTLQVVNFAEARLHQQFDGLGAALSRFAVDDDIIRRIELVHPLRHLAERLPQLDLFLQRILNAIERIEAN